ncbi:polyisoprenoid-binding protein [Bdellovibrio sp. qaytius]|nr:polyisoprenoid-binding protein [Bdellovibrio sp. qaytius]
MNHKQTLLIALAISTLGFTTQAADKAKTKEASKSVATVSHAGKYNLDEAHSKVGFEIPHLVISSVEGRFTKFEGEIELADKFTDSKVNATIDIASIDTSNGDRDKHLKSPDFFDAAKYPKMTFKSKKITGTAEKFKIVGDLTIKETTKEVTLDGKFLGVVKDAYGNDKAAFTASTKINRQEYGLKWGKMVEAGPAVGDEVTITLKVQGAKAK